MPQITNQPEGVIVTAGEPATFQVGAFSSGPLGYQWQFEGTNIVDATNAIFYLSEAESTNTGYYDAVVASGFGSVTSSVAALDVVPVGAPNVYINSNLVAVADTVVGDATVSLAPGFTNGLILFTLDGSDPEDGGGILYEGPFVISNSALIRAACYSADFSLSAEMLPLALQIVPGFEINTSVAGGGTVNLNPNATAFASNSLVTVTAVANPNWVFDHWQGAVTSYSNPLTLAVRSNLSLQAVFTLMAFPLTLTTAGGGTIHASGQTTDGINFTTNSVVTLIASNSPGWTFLGWQGGVAGAANPCSLIITQATSVQAVFGTGVGTSPVGGGQIIVSTTNLVGYGSNVTVSAVANNGDYFVAWDGLAAGTNSPASVQITNASEAVDALFLPLPENKFSLSLAVLGNGAVNISPQQNYYDPGQVVTLTALPGSPATTFYGWMGSDNYTNQTTTVTMVTNLIVYANFAALPPVSTAQATALTSSGSCSATTMTSGGFGYTNTPAVTLVGGGGNGATAVAVVQNGIVVAVNIISAGSGYTNPPQIVIEPPVVVPPQLGILQASGLIFSNLTVSTSYLLQEYVKRAWTNLPQAIAATNSVMTQWVNGAAGPNTYRVLGLPLPVTATAVPITSYGYVVFVTVTDGGSGYTNAPAVTILGGGGSGATATAVATNGVVAAVNITDPGSGYTNIPTIMIAAQPLAAIYGEIQPGILLTMSNLMTNQLYQLQTAPQIGSAWFNATNGYFISTNSQQSEYLFTTNSSGYYRLQYLP